MTTARDELERRIRDLLSQTGDPAAAFERSPFSEDPTARRIFEELMQAASLLDAAGHDARTEMEEALALESASGEGRLMETIERLSAGEAPLPERGIPWTRVAGLVGLAAALVLALVWIDPFGGEPNGDHFMGPGDEPTALSPAGEVEAWGTFTWPAVPEGGVWYLLRIEDGQDNVLVEERCDANAWTAPAGSALQGIERVDWSVEARDAATGAPRDEHWSASAWLGGPGAGD